MYYTYQPINSTGPVFFQWEQRVFHSCQNILSPAQEVLIYRVQKLISRSLQETFQDIASLTVRNRTAEKLHDACTKETKEKTPLFCNLKKPSLFFKIQIKTLCLPYTATDANFNLCLLTYERYLSVLYWGNSSVTLCGYL